MATAKRTIPRLTDPGFRYISSIDTDLRKTFARVREDMQKQAEAVEAKRQRKRQEAAANVSPMFQHDARKSKATA